MAAIDIERASVRHGIQRVKDQIDDTLLQLVEVADNRRQIRLNIGLDTNVAQLQLMSA